MLVKAVLNTGGAIVELGCGWYSTPILAQFAVCQRRHTLSCDNNKQWLAIFEHFANPLHKLVHIEDWNNLNAFPCGLLFVDQAPGNFREHSINKFRQFADVMVLHDTENQIEYGYSNILGTFKYEHTDKTQPTWTTVVSNIIDVTGWGK